MPVYDTEKRLASAMQDVSHCDTHPANKQACRTFKIEAEASGIKPITVERYMRVLLQICSYIDYPLTDMSNRQAKQLVADINNNRLHSYQVSPWTRKKYKSVLSKAVQLLDIQVDLGFMSINVKRSEQKELTPHKYPDRHDVAAMIQHCNNPRDKALIAALWDTGARISSVLQLTWNRVSFNHNEVEVLRSKTGSRTIPVEESIHRLRTWYETALYETGYVFSNLHHNDGNDCISYKRARMIIDQAADRCDRDIPLTNPHAFRKGRACYLAKQDQFNAFQLAQWMGWQDLETARHYVKIVNTDLQRSVQDVMENQENPRL